MEYDFDILHYASVGDFVGVRTCIKNGIDVNFKNDTEGNTSLNGACWKRNIEMVKLLIDNGANPNIKNRKGLTAIMYAASQESFEIVEYLILNGADPTISCDNDAYFFNYANRDGDVGYWLSGYETQVKIIEKYPVFAIILKKDKILHSEILKTKSFEHLEKADFLNLL